MNLPPQRGLFSLFITLIILSIGCPAQILKSDYLRSIKIAADRGWRDYPQSVEDWKKKPNNHELWGYDAPAGPVYLADLLGYLYQETNDRSYAEKARDILASSVPGGLGGSNPAWLLGDTSICSTSVYEYIPGRTALIINDKTRCLIAR